MKSFRIGIDCRKMLDYGIGTITRNLILNLGQIDRVNTYYLFGDPGAVPNPCPNMKTVRERAASYSLAETISLPVKSRRLRLDLLHWMHYAYWRANTCRMTGMGWPKW